MRTFHVALTGDFLDETGRPAYGDAGLDLLSSRPYLRYRYLMEQAPRPGDGDYWKRFYSLEVAPEQVEGINGLVVLRPWLKRATLGRAGAQTAVAIPPSPAPVAEGAGGSSFSKAATSISTCAPE